MKPSSKRTKKGPEQTDTRQKIVNATLVIAAEKGFDQTTTARIARAAGVAEGSIYNYFRTKDELLIHTVSKYASSFLSALTEALQEEEGAQQKLERLVSFHIRFFSQEGNIFQVVFGKTPGAKVQMARILHTVIVPYAELIEQILQQGMKSGVIKKVNAQVAASFLLGGMQLTLLRNFFHLAEYSPDQMIEEIGSIYLSGLLSRPMAAKEKRNRV